LQPDRIEDLIAVNALYRPGPLGSGMVDDYIDRRHGKKQVVYMFPELESVLAETYGVIVYQEQVMKIACVIAGYTLGGADILRRAMGKKKVEVMEAQKALFVEGATKNGFVVNKAAELFDLMAYFAGYGFNKSHSAAYALIAYHTAYLKANYPREFMAALITFETDNPDNLTKYLQEIHDMGIATIPPHINISDIEFTAHTDGIVFGLKGIKNVGLAALQNILEERARKPFETLFEFCKRIDLRTANKRVIESLIYAGAMDCLPGNRAQKIAELDTIIERARDAKETKKTGQMGLFGAIAAEGPSTDSIAADYIFAPRAEWSDKEKLEKEREVAGFYLSSHPLKAYPAVQFIDYTPIVQALNLIKNVSSLKEPTVTCCGLIQTSKTITTKKGDRMAFAQCEDLTGSAEIIIFPRLFSKVETLLEQHNVFIIKGTLDITSQSTCKIKANDLIPAATVFDDPSLATALTVTLPDDIQESTLQELKNLLPKGALSLQLAFKENNHELLLATTQKVGYSLDILTNLKTRGFVGKIVL
ncbi:MAG: DNA polymerase III subunit alpha, partial [Candidatus Babeliales bacterium]